jgi:CHAT domain-containing protein
MTWRRRAPWIAVTCVLVVAVAAAGCSTVRDAARSVARTGASVPRLGRLTGGWVRPEVAALIVIVGPAAVEAVRILAASWAQHAAERREADQREQEARRLYTAEAQTFYADQCTQKAAPAPASDARAGAPADAGAALEKEAEAAFAAGDHARAAKLLQQLYDQRKDALGEKDPEFARVANKLAVVHLAAGDAFHAMALAMQALEVRRNALDAAEKQKRTKLILTLTLDIAESETTVAHVYRSGGAYDVARKNYQHALEVRAQHLGEDHLCVAQSQNNMGEMEYLVGAYVPALALYRSALATRTKRLAPDHRDLAQSYDDLGSLHRAIALYPTAKEYYEKALAIRLKLGDRHPEVADSWHNLAALHRAMGDFTLAESTYEKALAIRKFRFGDGLPVAETETSLAELYFAYGDYARAEGLLQHAHGIRKERLPSDHPDLAESLADLARLHQARRELDKAERDTRDAVSIWEKRFGSDHPVVASGLAQLGELYLEQGRLDDAQKKLEQARAIREEKLGADNPATAESLHQLGCLHYARFDYARAEPLFRAAVDLRIKKLGAGHPDVAASLSYLAALLVATNRLDEALKAFRQAQIVSEQLLTSVGAVAGEARLDAILRFLRAQEEVVYSLLEEPDLAPRAAPLALSLALLRKGRSVDEAAGVSQAVYQGLGPADQQRFRELRLLRGQLARQRLSHGDVAPEEPRKISERAERIEQELAQHSAALRARRDAPTLDDVAHRVAAALPPGTILVEVVRYRAYRFHAKPGQPRWGDLRYAAMVLGPSGAPKVATLGSAVAIDGGVRAFLKTITEGVEPAKAREADAAARKLGQELDRLVLQPMRPFLGTSRRLVLSLDGELNLLPFWAIHDGKEYAIDRYDVTYVTSGRDLLPHSGTKRSSSVALLARPTFVKDGAKVAYDEKAAARGFGVVEDATGSLTNVRLAPGALRLKAAPSPLPGTEQEARAIRQLIPGAKLLVGDEATKDRFLGLQAPGIVHVATHGLFRPQGSEARGGRGLELTTGLLTPTAPVSRRAEPLLNSMLLWAGVGVPMSTADGAAVVLEPAGLATALEVAGMNLWGTQLVVLSACETGRGQVDDVGQGVYGLRRAVIVAGAETLVTSLWKVDDDVTRELMIAYYRKLLAGAGRGEALREASLQVRRKHPEPRYWAPFIAIGQVGPLKGIR